MPIQHYYCSYSNLLLLHYDNDATAHKEADRYGEWLVEHLMLFPTLLMGV